MLNVGERSVQRARKVIDEGTPELAEAVDRGAIAVSIAEQVATLPESYQREILAACGRKAISEVYRKFTAEEYAERRASAIARTKSVEFNAKALGKFAVIYADPPWRYENPAIGGRAVRSKITILL